MSRYGWSLNRDRGSRYGSRLGSVPAVTDDDFSYITSQDLDDAYLGPSDGHYSHPRSQSAAPPAPEDDVLLIKNKGVTYPAHFPAYSIGEGKLCVRDVRERVGLMMELPDRAARRIKLLYKGKQLKESVAPVRDYGVKNKSELMAVLSDVGSDSSPSEEEMVIVGDSTQDETSKSRRRKKKPAKKRPGTGGGGSASSPHDSKSNSRSPPPPAAGSDSLRRIEELSSEFTTKWLPLCIQYTASPPSDPINREEEHRKLAETLMHILFELDGVATEGNNGVRGKRREVVQRVQEVLNGLDAAAKQP